MKQHDTIAVVGAGIIGCSAAWALAKSGFSVLLLDERAGSLQGISSAGFGSLTPFSDPFYRGEARDSAARAVSLYRDSWLKEICEISQCCVPLKDFGLLQLCLDHADISNAERLASELTASGYEARMLNVTETRELEPALSSSFRGSLWMNEPWIDREQYYNALSVGLSRKSGVQQHYNASVVEIRTSSSVLTLLTKDGRSFDCSGAVICNGLTDQNISGLPRLPLKWVRGDAVTLHTTNGEPLLRRHIYCHQGFITPREHSEMLLGRVHTN